MANRYTGARGKLTPAQAEALGTGWALQPKLDGVYAELHLDSDGCIAAAVSRAGKPLSTELLGRTIGTPNAILTGELESHTQCSQRLIAERGYQMFHAFDCISDGERPLHAEPYRARRDSMMRILSAIPDDRDWQAAGKFARGGHGRWTTKTASTYQRIVAAPQLSPTMFDALWADWVAARKAEGLVAVDLDAPVGRSRAKYKIKTADTLDARVVRVDTKRCVVSWFGRVFTVGLCGKTVREGEMIEVAYDGLYDSEIPRFPRIVRRRTDLR